MSDRLTVLITNVWLVEPGGTQVVVRDVALGLARRGHRPIVYSPMLGKVSDALAAQGISVIDDLSRLGEAPDIIHGQHCIPSGEALIRFPDTPAIYVCHGFTYWVAEPIHFPQIGAYVAVDDACRDRLVHTGGIDPGRVLVIPNAVDLERIPARRQPLAERPRRALAFGKAAAAPEIREACAKAGVAFDIVGGSRFSATPERALVECDLVFASARAALEAMCCGCAVIVCDQRGFCGMVEPDNFEALRALNFGLRSLTKPVTVGRCVDEITRYDRHKAMAVSQAARKSADLNASIDRYIALYRDVISGPRQPTVDGGVRKLAETKFLHHYLPRGLADPRWLWPAERESLRQKIETLTKDRDQLRLAIARRGDAPLSGWDRVKRLWRAGGKTVRREKTGGG